MDGKGKETNMNPKEAQRIRDTVGLSPKEVEKINQSKPNQGADQGVALNRGKDGLTGLHPVTRAVNIAAAGFTAVAGVGLAATAGDALKNTPSPIIQEAPEQDPLNRKPPKGVVFTPQVPQGLALQNSSAPAGQEFNVTNRVFLPSVFNNASRIDYTASEIKQPEVPAYLREFGDPERGVIMRNKIEQGGGNPAWVEMGDQELWNNLMYLRETYGAKDADGRPLKLEITYYSSRDAYYQHKRSAGFTYNSYVVLPWDVWAGHPGLYQNGIRYFYYREEDKTLEFRITLPETLPGKVPTEDSVNKMHMDFTNDMMRVFLAKEDGKPTEAFRNFSTGREPEYSSFLNYPVRTRVPNSFNTSRSALWIKLE